MIVHKSQMAQLFTNGKYKLRWGACGAIACFAAVLGAAEIPDMPATYRADPKAVVAAANTATAARFPDADRVMVDDRIHVAYQPDGSEIT